MTFSGLLNALDGVIATEDLGGHSTGEGGCGNPRDEEKRKLVGGDLWDIYGIFIYVIFMGLYGIPTNISGW